VDLPNKVIRVKHQDIPGLMPAMTMSFLVANAREIEDLQPGDTITAEIVISESKGRLEKIGRAKKADQEIAAPVADPHREP